MEPNQGPPLGVPMAAEYRYYGDVQPKPVGPLAIAASVLIGLVALLEVLETIATANGTAWQVAMFSLLYLLMLAGAGVVFVVWLWRARSNIEAIAGPQTQRLGKGWGIGCWICPIVNFWFPYRYVVDVWRASTPNRDNNGSGLVLGWWLTYLAGNIIAFSLRSDAQSALAVLSVSAALHVVAGVLAIMMIRRITAWQSLSQR